MLERARATSIGLLGFTAAVGLAIVAIVFNQGWPLPAGGPVPPLPPQHQGLGEARVASGVADDRSAADVDRSPGQATAETGPSGEARSAPVESSSPSGSAELVVAPSAPARSDAGDAPRGDSSPKPPPARPAPESPPAAPSQPAEPAAPPPAVEEPEPPATASEAPPTSSVPPWSNGKGHAYGRSGREADD
ncbi:MAG TPA: hypothetical protein VIS95_07990 [Solirubrobacterales bacterium]